LWYSVHISLLFKASKTLSNRLTNATILPYLAIDNGMSDDNIEMQDSMGKVSVPADALYQAQTQRALDNFNISSLRLPASLT